MTEPEDFKNKDTEPEDFKNKDTENNVNFSHVLVDSLERLATRFESSLRETREDIRTEVRVFREELTEYGINASRMEERSIAHQDDITELKTKIEKVELEVNQRKGAHTIITPIVTALVTALLTMLITKSFQTNEELTLLPERRHPPEIRLDSINASGDITSTQAGQVLSEQVTSQNEESPHI